MPSKPPVHRPPGWVAPSERKKEFDQQRENSSQRGYDSKWRKARQSFLNKNPLCRKCQSIGIIKQADVVDHIKPHKGNQKLFWDKKNWQPLCYSCHSRKTALEDSRFTSWNSGEGTKNP